MNSMQCVPALCVKIMQKNHLVFEKNKGGSLFKLFSKSIFHSILIKRNVQMDGHSITNSTIRTCFVHDWDQFAGTEASIHTWEFTRGAI